MWKDEDRKTINIKKSLWLQLYDLKVKEELGDNFGEVIEKIVEFYIDKNTTDYSNAIDPEEVLRKELEEKQKKKEL